ncbi:hypothetical protein C9J21_04530 [Photobacterium phosphoreum]|uniref:hypothetical protein n=1 Tax=Photobacterium phosphoreum TaxID=659 RepID=UPI000D1626F0|nr:hypothetical protein [Photobacterium phosphoreum]PSU69757.1 hypothetical protein C9J22_12825 [Photobacterium phosphoreum]PSU74915.1 hypothetical protein CTM67_17355 [Photobacterium phosphoreum]PSU85643.1 hypothetical protein CTM93_04060 [Photobacterium phosphoreum]PSW34615.1 hypothetical protein C9J21_04530 [Photobacterium phosphoreum]PTB32005.1 hypothetical protein DAT36_13900 [Photobacterium phosphoreum]
MMRYITHILFIIISLTSYSVSAKDGDFIGKVRFDNPTANHISLLRYMVSGSIDKSHSGVLIKQKVRILTFQEKLLSAADK